MEHAVHVAFVADAEIIRSAHDSLVQYESTPKESLLTDVLERAYHQRWERRNTRTIHFDEAVRLELSEQNAKDPELSALVTRAPQIVRRFALTEATHLTGLLVRLREINAPTPVHDSTRRRLLQAIIALDPTKPLPREAPPAPKVALSGSGVAVANLHDWLGTLLTAAFDSSRGLCCLNRPVQLRPATASGSPETEAAPGIEFTSYGMSPESPIWHAREFSLPRPLHGQSIVVVGVAGGPASFALATDEIGGSVHPTLSEQAAALQPHEALVSFIAIESDVEWPWTDLH